MADEPVHFHLPAARSAVNHWAKTNLKGETIKDLCTAFSEGTLRYQEPADVLHQLSAEGTKRLESFAFELILRLRLNRMTAASPDLTVSFGWHIGYNQSGEPAYWFRLMDDNDDWNTCDD